MIRLRNYLDLDEIKLVYAFLLSLPGAPFIYYGDEIGMRHLNLVSVEGGYSRTGARTPMQWNHEKNYGFSGAEAEKLYTQQDPAKDAPVVCDQMAQENSLWREVQKLIRIRKEHPALCASGKIAFICTGENYPLAYIRSDENEQILVVVNPCAKEACIPCAGEIKETIYSWGAPMQLKEGMLHIPGESAAYLRMK